jgi:3-oxoacyl-[acyl-carrier protein] reductase
MDLLLNSKTAVVMGSSQGLGRAIAECLIKEGVKVILSARNEEALKKTQGEIKAQGYVVSDLTQPGAGTRLAQQARELLGGRVDILVTNTGGPAKGNFAEVTREQWLTDFQSLWLSPVEAMQELFPSMKEHQYGRVVMVTSIAAKEPLPGLTTSNGLRAGLEGLVKSISHEVARDGITLNVLRPGYTNTDRLKELNLSSERVKTMVPAGRLGEPEELASLATFLASPLAGYITGQCVSVDGGVERGH